LRVGRWAQSANKGEVVSGVPYQQQHIWAEFFCDGIGWVPADPAVGMVFQKKGAALEWFGHDRGNFLTMHLDHHLVLDSARFGRPPEPWLQNGAYWVNGTGSLDGATFVDDWQVREVK